jgi:hypothetical protein
LDTAFGFYARYAPRKNMNPVSAMRNPGMYELDLVPKTSIYTAPGSVSGTGVQGGERMPKVRNILPKKEHEAGRAMRPFTHSMEEFFENASSFRKSTSSTRMTNSSYAPTFPVSRKKTSKSQFQAIA